jgi:uncharacterized protein YjiS (DUF1127 family)
MSLINLFVAARAALARGRQRRRAFDELMALDDRTLADIGIHRSQIPGLVHGMAAPARVESLPETITAAALGRGAPRLANGQRWMPPF